MTRNLILFSHTVRRKWVWKSKADCSIPLDVWQSSYKSFKNHQDLLCLNTEKKSHHVSSPLAHPGHSEPIQWYPCDLKINKTPTWIYPHLLGFTYSFDCKISQGPSTRLSFRKSNVGHPVNPLSLGPPPGRNSMICHLVSVAKRFPLVSLLPSPFVLLICWSR